MKRNNGITAFQARIADELNDIREVVERVEKKLKDISQTIPDDFTIVGFAGYVHSFYNGLEKIFDLIADYIDHFEPPDKAWHKELLKQMTRELQGVRPAVLTKELAAVLEDYLEFRHFFRHSYSYDVDWDELKPKAENLKPIFEKFEAALQQFFVFLQAAEQID
jgi:uncharacterized protein YutE (UPF0331/DUF86 family)